ncbi:MAG TPA: WhiB family transcriptional regulator [Pseudonocardiaceae bacterium]|nr:WhiB family transcriptional regulator [Pseudonocardiaceae bacterium]
MNPHDNWLIEIAARLDRLIHVPTDVLADIVMADGACVWCYGEGDPPPLTGEDTPDRELAARICAGCPVQDECLELELRYAGPETVGVWGALAEDDRRALYPLWRARGHQEVREVSDGGDSS